MGIGTSAWGGREWGYGSGYGEAQLRDTFEACLGAGLRSFDTAEVYGDGEAERLLGSFISQVRGPVQVASKYMTFHPLGGPRYFSRIRASALPYALDASLERLKVSHISLYQIHHPPWMWPRPNELMDALAAAVEQKKVAHVGVCNFDANQLRGAHAALLRRGVRLYSNQIEYSLLHRAPERNGVLTACRDLGVTVMAHCPLGRGALTGGYGAGGSKGLRPRSRHFSEASLRRMAPLVDALEELGRELGGRSPSQISISWLLSKGVVPIPGAKTPAQAQDNAGALGWQLTRAQGLRLDQMSEALCFPSSTALRAPRSRPR